MATVGHFQADLLKDGIQAKWGEEVTSEATPLADVLWLELKPSTTAISTASSTADGVPATGAASAQRPPQQPAPSQLQLSGLSSLEVLCISGLGMTQLAELPLLPKLKRLQLMACTKLEHLPGSIERLKRLEYLVVTGASSLQDLPPAVCSLSTLRVLCIEGAGSVTQLPRNLGSLSKLELLMVQGTSVRQLPETLPKLEKLELLDLYGSSQLERLPESLDSLRSLKVLDLQDCVRLTALPGSIGGLSALQALHLTGCKNITALPGSLGRLKLTLLDLRGCKRLQEVPASIAKLSKGLQSLWISDAPSGADAGTKLTTLVQRSQQRHAIRLMATQQAPMLLTLERMSWLVVLLATAAFIAFLQPPGGYDQNEVQVSNSTACAPGSSVAGSKEFQQCSMLLFFIFDSLSFGLSLGCVMMIVVMSMPRLLSDDELYEAGRFWLLLLLTWVLLWLSVVSGFAAFAASGLAVHKQVKMVLFPLVPGMVLLCTGLVSIVWRFHSLHPGRACVLRALHLR